MAKRRPPTVHGLAIIDKPAGVTSHDVVNQLRKILGERRIGHAGTLDPDATGVLLVGVGYVTRLMQFLSGMDKTYTAEVVFGAETNTLDSAGVVTATHDMPDLSIEKIREAATKLTGQIMQVPPMVSALRVDGRRLHELAREGVVVERKARPVTVCSHRGSLFVGHVRAHTCGRLGHAAWRRRTLAQSSPHVHWRFHGKRCSCARTGEAA
jgi:tRNA pseudouridine55 synthase